jgi:hypothetical protein
MGTMLLAALVLGSPAQDKPLGEISKEQLFQEIRAMGFVLVEEEQSTVLIEGVHRVQVGVSLGRSKQDGSLIANSAGGRVEFDLPKSFPKKEFQDWCKAQGFSERVTTGSFLGGRIFVSSRFMWSETTRPELRRNIRELLDACSTVAKMVEKRGGKVSATIHALGTSPYEPDFKLDWIEQEDMDYMREKLKWGHTSGVVMRGWVTGGVVLGVPIVFTGGFNAPGIDLTFMPHEPSPSKLARFLKNPVNLDWAEYHEITEKSVYIQKRLGFPDGVTVRGLEKHILDFAKKVKALDLL